jgi:xanthine dehydrogenase accessory factor
MTPELLQRLNAERAARRACVVLTRLPAGEQELVTADALVCEPWAADPRAALLHEALRTGRSTVLQHDGAELFIAVHAPSVRLVVTGAVHITQALAPIARELSLDLTVLDPRTAFASPERFPGVRLIADWPDDALPAISLDRHTAFVALTHDPKIDDPALFAALKSECFYIGALGSRKTHARRVERLREAGFGDTDIARIRAPIGLNIGAVSPAEIALSIAAEIIATLRAERVAAKAAA